MESEHRSDNAAAAEIDIPPTQAIRHLQKQGITYQSRPRIQDQVKSRLEALLKTGVARNMIAETLNIRKGYIKDYLAKKPRLRHVWEKAHGDQLASADREHFLKLLEDNPGAPIKRIRRIPKSGFEWLYRNDRDWLANILPSVWRRPSHFDLSCVTPNSTPVPDKKG